MSKKICIVAGARPNFIKVAPVMRAIENARNAGGEMECKLVYTGREDDETLEDSLFSDLGIRKPDVYLGVECENMNELTGMVMAQFERYLQQNPTDVVIVVDDLASTMAVAIVTKKQGVQLAHIAAGTRSFDITMPKEINRLVIDGLSDILFTAGISNNSIANKEGAELSKVYMVGNVLIDNIRFLQQRMKRPQVMDYARLTDNKGQKADFRNVILVMTSNAGAQYASQASVGFGGNVTRGEAMLAQVKKTFKPEFINRLSDTVVFNDMDKHMAELILAKKLRQLDAKLAAKGVSITLTDAAREKILEWGFTKEYGAREMDRVIGNRLKPILMKALLFGKLKKAGKGCVDFDGKELVINC